MFLWRIILTQVSVRDNSIKKLQNPEIIVIIKLFQLYFEFVEFFFPLYISHAVWSVLFLLTREQCCLLEWNDNAVVSYNLWNQSNWFHQCASFLSGCFTYLSFPKHRLQKFNVMGLEKVQRIQMAVECLPLTGKSVLKDGYQVPSLPLKSF